MSGVDLGKMIGPMPLGAWVGVIGAGLGIALYTRRGSDTSEIEIVSDTSGVPGVGEGGSGMIWSEVSPPTSGGPVAPAISTNEDWGRAAVNYLIASGYNPLVADSAIRKYLGGESLSAQEFSLCMAALAHLGAPPTLLPPPLFGAPSTPVAPSPAPGGGTGVSQPAIRYYVVKKGDNLNSIAGRYGVSWHAIFSANWAGKLRADGTKGLMWVPADIARIVGKKIIIPN